MGRRGYPAESRRRVLELLQVGRRVMDLAEALESASRQSTLGGGRPESTRGWSPGSRLPSKPSFEPRENVCTSSTSSLRFTGGPPSCSRRMLPKVRYAALKAMAAEGLSVQTACRVLGVSEPGYCEWRKRPASAREVRHPWLTDVVTQVHGESRGTYGGRRVHRAVAGESLSVGK